MKTALEIVRDGLTAHGLDVLLIGGFALPVYGVVRQTVDVDCLVVEADEPVLHEVLIAAGYEQREHTEAFVRFTHREPVLMDVDLMVVDGPTFGKMLARSAWHRVGSVEFRIPCLPHLIALKLHAIKNNPKRELKDLGDIVALLAENPEAVPRDELQALCERYGPEGVFAKLEAHL